jgi:hypothetical protein
MAMGDMSRLRAVRKEEFGPLSVENRKAIPLASRLATIGVLIRPGATALRLALAFGAGRSR